MVGRVERVRAPVFNVRLLKVIAFVPFTVPAPAKFTVLIPLVKVPLFVSVPLAEMDRLKDELPEKLSPPLMVTEFANALAVPIFTVNPNGITALVVLVGTPPHQLAGVCQSPLFGPT
jgi:hypothetical protein